MTDTLRLFAEQVTRVAREVGTEGKLGGQAEVPGVAGTWKDLTDTSTPWRRTSPARCATSPQVTTAVAQGDLCQKITVDAKGEILRLKDTINTMVDQLALVRRRGHARGARGRHRGPPRRPGGRAGRRGHLEGPDREGQLHGANLTDQVRNIAQVTTAVAKGDLTPEDHRRRQGRGARAQEHDQHDGRPAALVRRRGHARRARGRHRGPARRPGRGRRRIGHLARPDRERQPAWPTTSPTRCATSPR